MAKSPNSLTERLRRAIFVEDSQDELSDDEISCKKKSKYYVSQNLICILLCLHASFKRAAMYTIAIDMLFSIIFT